MTINRLQLTTPMPPERTARMDTTAPAPEPEKPPAAMSLRPYDPAMLAGLARGQTVPEIASTAGTPYDTVRNRIHRMARGLGISSAAALVDRGYRYGWLQGLRPEPRPPIVPSNIDIILLHCLAADMSNPRVAARLEVSTRTAAKHLRRLYTVLGARNRWHAVALGHQQGCMDPRTVASAAAATASGT